MRRRLLAALLLLPLGASGAAAQVESSAAGQSGTSQPSTRLRDAGAALQRGNADQAITLYNEALDDKALPNDRRATILNDRGVAYSRRQQYKEAIDDFNRAIQLYPEYAAVYNNRGNVLLGPRRRARGGQGLRPRAASWRRDMPPPTATAPAPTSSSARSSRRSPATRRHRADAQQPGGAERTRTGPARGKPAARRDPRFHAGGQPRCPLRRRLPQPCRGQAGRSSATRRRSRTTAGPSPSSRATPSCTRCAGRRTWSPTTRLRAQGLRKAIELSPSTPATMAAAGSPSPGRGVRGSAQRFRARHRARSAFAKVFAYRAWTYRQQQQPELGVQGHRARLQARRQQRGGLLGARRDQRGAGAHRGGDGRPQAGAVAHPRR